MAATKSPAPPHPHATCDMFGGTCPRPAVYIVDAHIRIGADDWAPLRWMTCADLACVAAANLHAEAYGEHVDTRPITLAEAEALTGLKAGVA